MKTLTKEHSNLALVGVASQWDVDTTITFGSWTRLTNNLFCSKTYFDLAGMSMDEKTLFFEASGTQTTAAPAVTTGASGDLVFITDLMSSSPLTDADLIQFQSNGNFAQPGAVLTWDETIYARSQQWAITINEAASNFMVLLNEEQFGSMSPTASDRIYSYRIVLAKGVQMDSVYVYPSRHILRATAKEESDHEYIMRLLRSYQLQQEPDVD